VNYVTETKVKSSLFSAAVAPSHAKNVDKVSELRMKMCNFVTPLDEIIGIVRLKLNSGLVPRLTKACRAGRFGSRRLGQDWSSQ
jgi:hypothetical protein